MFVTGDSWTSCWPLEEKLGHRNFGWPTLVASHFNYNLIDKSRGGSSNYRIYRKAFEGILDENVDLVIAFLSSWTRLETGSTYGEKPGCIYQHLPGNNEEIFKKFFHGYKNYTDSLRMIVSIQTLSKQYSKPLYLLDTFRDNIYKNISLNDFIKILKFNDLVFDHMPDQRMKEKFNKVKLLEKHIDWSMFIHPKSYQEIISGCKLIEKHPVEDGHQKISQVVIDYLQKQKDLKI